MFFDEAVVADEDEEEEDYEDDYAGEKSEVILPEEHRRAQARVEDRHRQNREFLSRTDDEIAKEYEERFKSSTYARNDFHASGLAAVASGGAVGARGGSAVLQQSLLPGVGDPALFYAKVKVGMEQSIVRSIMNKAIVCAARGQPLGIMSAFCTASKGYVYIEAAAEPFAREAVLRLNGVYQSAFVRVPIGQMIHVLNVTVTKKPLRLGQLVRIKRGVLKGDLCKVVDLIDGGESAFIQAVPRPDYTIKDSSRAARLASATASSRVNRVPSALFNPEEARAAGCDVTRTQHPLYKSAGTMYDVWNKEYFKGGYVYKEVKAEHLSTENVMPKLEELRMFPSGADGAMGGSDDDHDDDDEDGGGKGRGPRDEDSSVAGSAQSYIRQIAEQMQGNMSQDVNNKTTSAVPYMAGDLVQVVSGDLKGLVGKVTKISEVNKLVTMQTIHEAFSREIPIEISLLAKYIKPGQHVKVVQGAHVGKTGRVVAVTSKGDGELVAAVLTDTVNSEIICNLAHLQVSSDVTTGLDSLGGFEMYDLVAVGYNEFAVVVAIGAERLGVMDAVGNISDVKPQELQGKRNMQSARAHAFDSAHNTIGCNDVVNVVEGAHAKLTGTIKHIAKQTVWLHSNHYMKNAGIFVTKARTLVLAGNKQRNNALADGYMGMLSPHNTPVGASPSQRAPQMNVRGSRPSGNEVNSTIMICKGAWKGHLAQVVDATDTHFKVELLAAMKMIMIEKSKTIPTQRSSNPGANAGMHGSDAIAAVPNSFISTPHMTAETPRQMLGSETPLHYGGGNETPGRTPLRGDDADIWGVSEKDSLGAQFDSGYGGSSSSYEAPGSMLPPASIPAPPVFQAHGGFAPPPVAAAGPHYTSWPVAAVVQIVPQDNADYEHLAGRQAVILRVPDLVSTVLWCSMVCCDLTLSVLLYIVLLTLSSAVH
jgi:transcription elongation factor SPT5